MWLDLNALKAEYRACVTLKGVMRMPKGPRGEDRPADVIGAAIKVARVSVGDIEENLRSSSGRTRSQIAGAKARMEALSKTRRQEIAKKAARRALAELVA